jgi:hypothetical protein
MGFVVVVLIAQQRGSKDSNSLSILAIPKV